MDNLTENYANNVSARYNAKRNLYTNNDVLASLEKAELKLLNLRLPKKEPPIELQSGSKLEAETPVHISTFHRPDPLVTPPIQRVG